VRRDRATGLLALAASVLALATAYVAQYGFGLVPCELCLWQRVPYWLAIGAGLGALLLPARLALPLAVGAMLLLAGNALLGAYHAGVEWGLWENFLARCTPPPGPPARTVEDLMRALAAQPIVRCDEPAIRVAGLSMAGWNALYAAACATICVLLLRHARKADPR
jgi:disulfide bond formation protein DsbB